MHRIDCPWCGTRDEAEFQYQGDATVKCALIQTPARTRFSATSMSAIIQKAGTRSGGTT